MTRRTDTLKPRPRLKVMVRPAHACCTFLASPKLRRRWNQANQLAKWTGVFRYPGCCAKRIATLTTISRLRCLAKETPHGCMPAYVARFHGTHFAIPGRTGWVKE